MSPYQAAEQTRLKVLKSYEILDTPPEPDFDQLTHLAALICKTPIAVISLIDQDRYWCKSAIGLSQIENDRASAFCDHTIRGETLLSVSDARKDPHFSNNPFVLTETGIRFYAGMPLISPSGYALGALAVLDFEPRTLDALQNETLKTLASQVTALLELRRLQIFNAKKAKIMERVATESHLPQILDSIIDLLEKHDPRFKCSILLLDKDGKRLRHGSAPSLPACYIEAIDGIEIGPNVGSCGTAVYEGQPVIVADISTDPHWANYRDLALRNGLHACWSIPIMSASKKVLGAFAVYACHPCKPEPAELELVTSCSHIVSVALERLHATRAIRRQAALLDQAQDAIIVYDMDGCIHYWNKGAERVYGWNQDEMIGKYLQPSLSQSSINVAELTRNLIAEGKWHGEIALQRKDGKSITVESRKTLVEGEDRQSKLVFSISSDITQRKETEKKIHQLAFYDQLTLLPNRTAMFEQLKQEQAHSARSADFGAVIFIDLDNFKTLNDTLGHQHGDILLQQVAERLKRSVHGSDTVARFGGDEFALVLKGLGKNREQGEALAAQIAARILAAINEPYLILGHTHASAASVGVALFKGYTPEADELLKMADLAMYQAKASGRNAVRFFDPEMQEKANERIAIESDIRAGLQNNEFFLEYQPQVDALGKVVGAEALMRWRRPQGMVSPAQFIPIAEENGLILQLGHFALKSAMLQLVHWAKQPETAKLTLAVNVSAKEFYDPGFVQRVTSLLDRTSAPAHLLKLELTESMLVKNVDDTIKKMQALKAYGIHFSLDDFGTGYSSLSYLKRFPLDQLKIDQSFVWDALNDRGTAAIISTIIALSHTLSLAVIAEGVETQEQQQFLAGLGCNLYQGFLFSRALSSEDFEAWLSENRLTTEKDDAW